MAVRVGISEQHHHKSAAALQVLERCQRREEARRKCREVVVLQGPAEERNKSIQRKTQDAGGTYTIRGHTNGMFCSVRRLG